MSHNIDQQETPVGQTNPPAPSVTPPPPMGYPTKDDPEGYPQENVPVKTTSRGEGFWKGCCAGLCCCCALECCL